MQTQFNLLQPPGFRPTREFLPWRYIATPGVINRVTCRHSRSQRCNCALGLPTPAPNQDEEEDDERDAGPPDPNADLRGPNARIAVAEVDRFLSLIWQCLDEAYANLPEAKAALDEKLAPFPRTWDPSRIPPPPPPRPGQYPWNRR